MENQNIQNALATIIACLKEMICHGIGEPHHVFALSNMIEAEYNLTRAQSITLIEEATKIV